MKAHTRAELPRFDSPVKQPPKLSRQLQEFESEFEELTEAVDQRDCARAVRCYVEVRSRYRQNFGHKHSSPHDGFDECLSALFLPSLVSTMVDFISMHKFAPCFNRLQTTWKLSPQDFLFFFGPHESCTLVFYRHLRAYSKKEADFPAALDTLLLARKRRVDKGLDIWQVSDVPVRLKSSSGDGIDSPPAPAETPVEFAIDVASVLQRCSIDVPPYWNGISLSGLKNGRLMSSTEYTSFGKQRPRRLPDSGQADAIPSFSRFLPMYMADLRPGASRAGQHWTYSGSEEFDPIDSERIKTLGRSMIKNLEPLDLDMILNAPCGRFMPNLDSYEKANLSSAKSQFKDTEPEMLETGANITPQGSFVKIHHDEFPSICTARTHTRGTPAKLWLFFPPSQIAHLNVNYGDERKFLASKHEGFFIVQMDGESMFIPANVPHSVITLRHCFLVGQMFIPGPSEVLLGMLRGGWLADIVSDNNPSAVLMKLAQVLKKTLESNPTNIQEIADCWMSARGRLEETLCEYAIAEKKIKESWHDYIGRAGCPFCSLLTSKIGRKRKLVTPEQHVEVHFPNFVTIAAGAKRARK